MNTSQVWHELHEDGLPEKLPEHSERLRGRVPHRPVGVAESGLLFSGVVRFHGSSSSSNFIYQTQLSL